MTRDTHPVADSALTDTASPRLAFFPRNPVHLEFFRKVGAQLKRKGFDVVFIVESKAIDGEAVFRFEERIAEAWDRIDVSQETLLRYRNAYPGFDFMRALLSEREFNFYPHYFGDEPVPYERQLKYLVGCFMVFEEWLRDGYLQCVVSELPIGLADSVLYEVCQARGVKYLSARQSKMTPGIVLCSGYYDSPVDLAGHLENFKRLGIPAEVAARAGEHLANLRRKIEHPSYMEVTKKPFRLLTAYKVKSLFRRLVADRIPVLPVSARRHPVLNPLRWSLHRLRNILVTDWYRRRWFADRLPAASYFVYPLHYEPEASTTIRAFYFSDQLALIKLLAKVMPPGCFLVVKEHGGNQGYRKPVFYRELHYLPNVVLVDRGFDVSGLLRDCAGLITLTGRMGWEAIANNKPVIALGRTFWTDIDGVIRAQSWQELQDALFTLAAESSARPRYDAADVLAFAAAYISCVAPGAFVLNAKGFMADGNVAAFAELLTARLSGGATR